MHAAPRGGRLASPPTVYRGTGFIENVYCTAPAHDGERASRSTTDMPSSPRATTSAPENAPHQGQRAFENSAPR